MFRVRVFGMAAAVLFALFASTSQAQVKLVLKHPEGSKTTSESTLKMQQVMTIMGTEIETLVDQASTTSHTVGKRRQDGSLPIESKLESMKASITLPMNLGTISFDSTQKEQPEVDAQFKVILDAMKAVVGTEYTIVLGKDGKVSAVEGAEKALEKAQQVSPEAGDQLKSRLNAATIKRNATEEYERFPDILLRPGESWTKTEIQDIGGGQTLTYERRYEYQGNVDKDGKTLDKIGVKTTSVKYAMDPNANGQAKIKASDLKVGDNEGTILFDREAGRVVESKDKTQIKGSMTIEAAGQEIEAELDLTMDTMTVTKKT